MKYFSPFRFDDRDLSLWRGSTRVRLTHKAAALLQCLLDNAGAWVSKDHILAHVWPDTFVQPDNIKVLIREIRRGLGDNAADPAFIRSIRSQGYSFVAAVSDGAADWRPVDADDRPTFVNRGPELAELTDAFDAVLAGQSRVVLLTGERGIGKSTVCRMFLRMTRVVGPVRHAVGQCLARPTPAAPFAPFLDALEGMVRLAPGQVGDLVAKHAPDWRPLFPEWSEGGPDGPASGTEEAVLIDQLGTLLTQLATDLPFVLVLEDLQWADPSTWNALSALRRRCDPARFLLIGTGTDLPPFFERAPAGALGWHGVHTIVIPPFTETQVARYLSVRFGSGNLSGIAQLLHELTDGNPQLLTTCLENVIAQGLVRHVDGRWEVAAPIDRLEAALPGSVAEALEQRLDTVAEEDRTLLEHAALVGPGFTADLVATAAACNLRAVAPRLRHLAREGHLAPVSRERSLQGSPPAYQFRFQLQGEVLRQRSSMLTQMRVAQRLAPRRRESQRRPA